MSDYVGNVNDAIANSFSIVGGEVAQKTSGGGGGSGNVVGSGTSVVGNLPKLSDTTTTGLVDSGYKLLTQDTVITLAGTTETDFLNAWKEMMTYIPNEKYTITIKLLDGITQLPAPSASDGLNDAFGYKVSQNIIINGNISASVGNVGIVGSLGSAALTFAPGTIPSGTTVGMSIYFSNGNGTANWLLEGLAGTYQISDITGDVVTILTPGVTISSRVASSTRKVFVYKSILQNTSEDGSNGFALSGNGRLTISRCVLRGDAAGRDPTKQSIGVYGSGGSTKLTMFLENWYYGVGLTNTKIVGTINANGCWKSANIYACDISAYPKIVSTGAEAGVSILSTNGNIDIELHNNQTDIPIGKYAIEIVNSKLSLFSDAKIFSKEYILVKISQIYGVTSGTIYGEGDVIPLNSLQSNGNYAGTNDGKVFAVDQLTTSTVLPNASGKYVSNSASALTHTLPLVTLNQNIEITIKNIGAGTVTVDTLAGQTIDGSATATILPLQSSTFQPQGTSWLIN